MFPNTEIRIQKVWTDIQKSGCRAIKEGNRFLMVVSMILASFGILINRALAETYSLKQVIEYAQNKSPEAIKVKTLKENKYWQWQSYKSNYKPQLVLSSTLPSYQNRNIAILQDDGSIAYRNVNQSQANMVLSLEQNISLTEYNIALEEKDRAKQDFIMALRDYWLTYYSIRILTLYDFENNQQLLIDN